MPLIEATTASFIAGSIVELLKLSLQDRRTFEQVFAKTLTAQLKKSNKNTDIVKKAVSAILEDTEVQKWLNSPQGADDLQLLEKLSGKLKLDRAFLRDFFNAFETAVAKNETLNKIYQNRHAAALLSETEAIRKILSDKLTDEQQDALDDYRRRVRERFSTILLFGDSTGDKQSVFARMSNMHSGFVPLHLKAWQDQDMPSDEEIAPLNTEDIFFNNRERLILVRGLPGSGKTTLLRYLAWRYAAPNLQMQPVYVRLKDLELNGIRTLEAFIKEKVGTTDDLKAWISEESDAALQTETCFLKKPMLVLLDGVDEIEDAGSAAGFAEALDKLVRARKYCTFIVTSRPIKLKKEHYHHFQHLDLDVLTPEMIDAYIGKWFGADKEKIDALDKIFKANPRVQALAKNPFLLSMICYVFKEEGKAALVSRRSALYAACTERLLARMYAVDEAITPKLAKPQALSLLKDIALRYFLWQEADFPANIVNPLAQSTLKSEEPGLGSAFLDDLVKQTGLVQQGQDGYTFVHRTLWEYFTALAMIDKRDHNFVIRQAANPDWEEVVRLYAGLLKEDEEIKKLVAGLWNINRPLCLRVTTEVQVAAADLLKPFILDNADSQSKLLLLDSLAQSLPLIEENARRPLVNETLGIMLPLCRQDKETFCEVLYHAEMLLEQAGMQPLAEGGLVYDILELGGAAKRQREYLADPANKFEWVEVAGGEFMMGDDNHGSAEKPAHRVRVNSFRMMKHPVTNKLLAGFPLGSKYSNYGGESHPAIGNTWWEARYFALWLGCRLPTEAEWEYAARGGQKMLAEGMDYYFDGDVEVLPNHAWFIESGGREAFPVDKKNPHSGKENLNPLGLANMHGNVWDWCADWYGNYETPKNDEDVQDNPQGPKMGRRRVLRGGAFDDTGGNLRSAYRNNNIPSYRVITYSFRCVEDAF